MKQAVVIGAGVGGLATSIRLARKGLRVTVVEASDSVGGKLKEIRSKCYRFDAGPSLFTLPELIEDLYEDDDLFQKDFPYLKLDRSCHYFWKDNTQLIAYHNKEELSKEIENQLKVSSKDFMSALDSAAEKYDLLAPLFMEKSLHKAGTFFNKKAAKAISKLPKLNLMGTMDGVNQKLNHPKLVQLMNRYATYNGSDPYKAPGVLTMIPHLEFNIGTFFPKNGMIQISKSLEKLAIDAGVNFIFNTKAEKILHQNREVSGIQTSKGTIEAEVVVSNADIYPTYKYLLSDVQPPQKTLQQERSSSALIFYWGVKKKFSQLHLHNILFSEDYREEFKQIFDTKEVPKDPTVYINITSKYAPQDAPEGCENWFVMVNVPATADGLSEEQIQLARQTVINRVSQQLGENIESLIETEDVLHPKLIEKRTSSHLGALYGTSSNDRMSAFMRHPNFHSSIKGLWFCGGSVHPGGGIPLCLLSAKIISELYD
ncbi:MAG: phytoene desaturase [Flavobacteriales bacterium]|nr:phytoene desaturase [Flavobacteriales bacterium]